MAMTIADVLNTWEQMGVFAYLVPFLLIFAVIFAILEKSRILHKRKGDGNDDLEANRPLLAIIAASAALLALQLDMVSNFFTIIFPRMGMGLAVFLVFIIFIGFFYNGNAESGSIKFGGLNWVAWAIAAVVVIWTLSEWSYLGVGSGSFSLGWWIDEYFWSLVILGAVVWLIYLAVNHGNDDKPSGGSGGSRPKTN